MLFKKIIAVYCDTAYIHCVGKNRISICCRCWYKHRLSLSSCLGPVNLYCAGLPHMSGRPVTHAVFGDTIKGTLCFKGFVRAAAHLLPTAWNSDRPKQARPWYVTQFETQQDKEHSPQCTVNTRRTAGTDQSGSVCSGRGITWGTCWTLYIINCNIFLGVTCLESFKATELNKVFSGRQSRQEMTETESVAFCIPPDAPVCPRKFHWDYQARSQNPEKGLLASSCPVSSSVCPSAWNNSAPTDGFW